LIGRVDFLIDSASFAARSEAYGDKGLNDVPRQHFGVRDQEPSPHFPSFTLLLEGEFRRPEEDNQMDTTHINHRQKQVLANIARRLRRHADYLESLIRSGNSKKLAEACGMLHATETQLHWVRNATEPEEAGTH
jgi:hypothetical protein